MCKRFVLLSVLCVALLGSQERGNCAGKSTALSRDNSGGEALRSTMIIDSSPVHSAILCGVWDDLEKSLDELKEQFRQFSDDLKRVPQRQEFKKLEKELDRLVEEMKRAVKAAREKLKKEIVPRLKEEMKKLREKLRKLIQEDESKPIEV